ncbi:nucleotidyltransferase domain-containing protein [Actinoplanes sp. NPDC049599]|uniref:nucleotidyltransferase domain-containing protein n=1 Tax=Actinoplanes sp. NPDC049599 TaxID=3363903 RepID=UPI0037A89398
MTPGVDAWQPYAPRELADRLAGLPAPWAVAGGWAVDLFLGRITRAHHDLEITLPAATFGLLTRLFPGWEFHVPRSGTLTPADPVSLAADFQTWALDPVTRTWRFDVFREPHDGDTWICRRDPRIRRPYAEVVLRTPDGIPFVAPEVALLFKAKGPRDTDEHDLAAVLPELGPARRDWLATALAVAHPGHPWRDRLAHSAER